MTADARSAPAQPPTLPPAARVAKQTPAASPPGSVNVSDTAIRVDVAQLDKLMNLVGELVLARNQIVQFTVQYQDATLLNAAQRVNAITTELQESVMKTRMQPIGNVWAKFPRIAHDLALELGKEVQLVMEGKDTELDRTIIEAIKDPLTHLVRNAIDHGIEPPAARRAAGKPEQGVLTLRAFHEGGQVNIEIIDNGRGIDLEKVKEKAIQRLLISPDQAARMSHRELFNLVFLPGFSTAEKVTNVSGRGVGMDVVKTNIERIGGSVDVSSETGMGTTIKIKIPLTLAIIPALIVMSSGERFAIPQVSLLELLRLEGDDSTRGIEDVFGAPVYRLRGKLLPLVRLDAVLRLEPSAKTDVANIVVLKAGDRQFGLIVDKITDTQEIVVKPLSKHLKGLPVFAGATIMGDGMVALILDAFGLAQHARIVAQGGRGAAGESAAPVAEKAASSTRQSLLVFSLGTDHRFALPLSSVGRLEKFQISQIEREGSREVVQYRGQIMPLIRLTSLLGGSDAASGELPVVVCSVNQHHYGLVAGRIEDIVEETIAVQNEKHRPGILGSAVIHGRVTEMLDVAAILSSHTISA